MKPPVGLVSGSGINLLPLLDTVHREIPFHEVPGLREGGVKGHLCAFVLGECGGRKVVIQSGRLHVYEGWNYDEVTRTVDVLAGFGVKRIVFTNAVGGLRKTLRAGDLVAADWVRAWPCARLSLPEGAAPGFVLDTCDAAGTYVWMHGPCYETRAEIAVLRQWGAATVGMSTAPELERCRQLGIEGGMISCVTNVCGAQGPPITHEHVVVTASRASERLCALVRGCLGDL